MNFAEIEEKVVQWGMKRGVFSEKNGSSPALQCNKLEEEFTELVTAVLDNNISDVVDSLGDMMVVMTMIAYFHHIKLEHCYEVAYHEIKDRKGKMVDGLFVKE